MVILIGLIVGVLVAVSAGTADCDVPMDAEGTVCLPEEIAFEGFGLDFETGGTGIAQVLRRFPSGDEPPTDALPVDLIVTGPPSSQAGRGALSAEIGQQFSFLNVAAGVLADREAIFAGPSGWTSRVSMAFENETTSGAVELRTQLRQTDTQRTVGIELGPRLEQQLPRGMKLFLEGSAEARTQYDRTGERAPTGGPLQRPEVVGLSGTVGIAR